MLTFYSFYAFGFAQLNTDLGLAVMLILALLALLTWLSGIHIILSKGSISIFILFLISALLSLINSGKISLIGTLVDAVAMIFMCSIIFACFNKFRINVPGWFKWHLLLLLVGLITAIQLCRAGAFQKETLPPLLGFNTFIYLWNEKYYLFWVIFLTWTTISFFENKNILEVFGFFLIFGLTTWSLYTGYSDSARLAFITSLLMLLSSVILKKYIVNLLRIISCLYIFLLPFILSSLPLSWTNSVGSLDLNNAGWRTSLYQFTVDAILQKPLSGHGFGAAPEILSGFPTETGGHPHNIVLFFWLEMGLLGAFVLSVATCKIITYIKRNSCSCCGNPSSWAIFSSGFVIFSFSFDMWLPDTVLTYCLWLSMIALSCRSQSRIDPLVLLHKP